MKVELNEEKPDKGGSGERRSDVSWLLNGGNACMRMHRTEI